MATSGVTRLISKSIVEIVKVGRNYHFGHMDCPIPATSIVTSFWFSVGDGRRRGLVEIVKLFLNALTGGVSG